MSFIKHWETESIKSNYVLKLLNNVYFMVTTYNIAELQSKHKELLSNFISTVKIVFDGPVK